MKSPDLMTWLLEESDKAEDREADRNWLLGDTHLIVVAGRSVMICLRRVRCLKKTLTSLSDTTAATLTYLFYHLAREPAQVEKLRAELGPLIPDFTNFTQQAIQDAPHLNGAINETLRMYPPVPSGLLRDTPPEGLYIEDTFVPGNTTVSVPFRPLGHRKWFCPFPIWSMTVECVESIQLINLQWKLSTPEQKSLFPRGGIRSRNSSYSRMLLLHSPLVRVIPGLRHGCGNSAASLRVCPTC